MTTAAEKQAAEDAAAAAPTSYRDILVATADRLSSMRGHLEAVEEWLSANDALLSPALKESFAGLTAQSKDLLASSADIERRAVEAAATSPTTSAVVEPSIETLTAALAAFLAKAKADAQPATT